MSRFQNRFLFASLALSALALAGCGGGGGGSSSSTVVTPPPPAGNNVAPSWSVNDTVRVIVGGSQTVDLAFVSDDGNPVTNFQVTQNLSALPAGWTANVTSLSCASVATGNGCLILLNYAPTAVASGTLSIAYSYTDSQSKSRTGTATINYGATSHNNVVASIAPSQVTTAVGGTRSVTVLFTTDDGAAATNLLITAGLTGLPAGWSTPSTAFGCPVVVSGNGCLLTFTYAPTAAASGKLQISFSYADNAATASTGSITIPFAATSANHVDAVVSPAGQVTTVIGAASQNVSVSFATDDGKAATALQISGGLTSLPAGWTGPTTFTCATVSTGSGCLLNLSYAASAVGSGTLLLNYQYTNGAGAAGTGSVAIPYSATSDNNVVTSVSPSGQINALAGGGALDAAITFTTDDMNQANNLSITGGLSALPAGWTGPATFTCAGFATGNGCELVLHYAPTAVASGTVVLSYSYLTNSGAAKTGSITLPYQATIHNNLVATVTPSGQVTAVLNKPAPAPVTHVQAVNIAFTSDDGNPVTGVSVTSGLGALPADWAGPATYSCTSASTTGSCPPLTLTFTPTTQSAGPISLGYTYSDNSGAAQTGTVQFNFTSVATYFYAAEQTNTVLRCAAKFDGSLSGCGAVTTGFAAPYGLTFNGSFVYIADSGNLANAVPGGLSVCPVNLDGTFGTCIPAAPVSTIVTPNAVAVSGSNIYVADQNGNRIWVCTASVVDGTLSNCSQTAQSAAFNVPDGITIVNTTAYIVDYNGGNLTTCTVAGDTTLTACTQRAIGATPTGLAAYNGYLYVGTGDDPGAIKLCQIQPDGTVPSSSCTTTGASALFSGPVGFGFVNGFAYVSGYGGASGGFGGIAVCPLNAADGTFDGCVFSANKAIKNVNFFGLGAP